MVLALIGLVCCGFAAMGAYLATLGASDGRFGYYVLLASGSTLRLGGLALVGAILGLPLAGRRGQARWIGWLIVSTGAACAVVHAALTLPVFLAARSLGQPISIAESLFGSAASASTATPELVTFASGDGWQLQADLYRPPTNAANRRAAIVVVHGGAWHAGGKAENPDSNVWLASSQGYVVLDIDYRLAPTVGWRDQVGDVQRALTWLRAHAEELNVDPSRSALLGRSAGGHLALMAAYAPNADVAAIVVLYAPTDLRRLYLEAHGEGAADLRAGLIAALGKASSEASDAYDEASPIHHT